MKRTCTMIIQTSCFALALLSLSLTATLRADAVADKLAAGSQLESLTVGPTVYHNVLVRSVTARSAMITCDGGMKSILLRDLSPELQQRFGYSAEAERAEEAAAKAGQANAEKQQKARLEALRKSRQASRAQNDSKIDQLLRLFGQPPEIAKEVDLRSSFNELGLWVKDQGHRPSCAVFAMVSALEFQSAGVNGNAERFSEEYLYWATNKTLNRRNVAKEAMSTSEDGEDQSDAGFSLEEVATALRTYGIPPRDKVPNRYAGKAIDNPPEELIAEARNAGRTTVHAIPGHNGAALAPSIIHALNLGIPVPVGIRWPNATTWRSGYLNHQDRFAERCGHAVTIVGYKCATGRIEDTEFVFKNSWGPRWGQAGYGTATYTYLSKNMNSAVVLEVQPASR